MNHDHHNHNSHRHPQSRPQHSHAPSAPSHTASHCSPGGQGGGGEHDAHAGHSVEMFKSKFWVSLLLTIPTLIWGHMLQRALGIQAPAFSGSQWIPPVFGTAVFIYGGWVFIQSAIHELKARLPGMMTLIALAITVAFIFSLVVTLGFPGMPLWEELATLVTIMLLGHWIEMRSIAQAQGALGELAKLLPNTATRMVGSSTEEVPINELKQGDIVLVRPGASVPADGTVVEGRSSINEAMVTGESVPVKKSTDDQVIAGTVNTTGVLRVQVTATGNQTTLAGIMRLVEQAQSSKSRAQDLANRAAKLLTVVALIAGALTVTIWLLLGASPAYAIERLVTVLVISCPHALGLAIPLVIAISTTLGARSGLLVRNRRGLEEARNLNTVVFDKTGTLTLGDHRVVAIRTIDGVTEEDALRLAAAIEQNSEHPIAHAIVKSAIDRNLTIPESTQFESLTGRGVQGVIEGRTLAGGGPNLLKNMNAELSRELDAFTRESAGAGQSVVYLVEGANVLAAFAVADAIRPEAFHAVRSLHEAGIEVVMLTGDSQAVAESVAKELNIDQVMAQVLPEQKSEKIKQLQANGKRVAMVGDGVNDAPALVTADVGIAIGAGTSVAVEAGDIVLVRSDPRDVPRIIKLSRASYRKMVQNLWWAAGYNILAIPLAAGVLAPLGVVLSPAAGAVLMSLSTIVVAINAQLLRRASLV